MVNSVVYHPCTSRVTSRIHFFHIPLNYLGFYLSQFVELSLTGIFHLVLETFFQFMVLTFLENALNLCIFTHTLVPDSKLQVELFENLFPPIRNRWGKLRFALSKFNHKIWRWLGTLACLYFIWFTSEKIATLMKDGFL